MGAPGPNIRIGGNSADESCYQATSVPLPAGDRFYINQTQLQTYKEIIPLWNGSIVVDTNLRNQYHPATSAAHVAAVARVIGFDTQTALGAPFVEAVEIGNEPELFHTTKHQFPIRPPNYTAANYWADIDRYVPALRAAGLPPARVQCMVFCCNNADFDGSIVANLQRLGPGTCHSVSYHRYPHGVGPVNNETASALLLLANSSAAGLIAPIVDYVQAANALGIKFYIAEGGVIGPAPGFQAPLPYATALWLANYI